MNLDNTCMIDIYHDRRQSPSSAMDSDDEITVSSPQRPPASSPPLSEAEDDAPALRSPAMINGKPLRKAKFSDFQPSANTEEFKADLTGMGFDEPRVKYMQGKRGPRFDNFMQRPFAQTSEQREEERRAIIDGARASGRQKRKAGELYEPLVVTKKSSEISNTTISAQYD